MQSPLDLRAYADRCEADAAALGSQYKGSRPAWVSGDIGRSMADARAARMEADRIESGAPAPHYHTIEPRSEDAEALAAYVWKKPQGHWVDLMDGALALAITANTHRKSNATRHFGGQGRIAEAARVLAGGSLPARPVNNFCDVRFVAAMSLAFDRIGNLMLMDDAEAAAYASRAFEGA